MQSTCEQISIFEHLIREDNNDMIEFLITEGFDIDTRDHKGNAPIHYAIYYNRFRICLTLLTHNANTNLQNADGDTPINLAIKFNTKEIFWMLCLGNTNLNMKNHKLETPFSLAQKSNTPFFKNVIFKLQQSKDITQ